MEYYVWMIIKLFGGDTSEKKTMTTYLTIGLDLSLVSPAIVVYDALLNKWQFIVFAQSKKHTPMMTDNMFVLPAIPDTAVNDQFRYEHIVHHITKVLIPILDSATIRLLNIRPIFEAYAFPSRYTSGFSYKLHELGGLMKQFFFRRGITITSVPASRWKLLVLGNGHASKRDVYDFVVRTYPTFEFGQLWSASVDHPSKGPPHPLEDICDAVCIILSSLI